MMKHEALIRVLRFECVLLEVVRRSRNCFTSRVILAVGLMYWIDPWQLIPDRVPIFGYSDQLLITLASLAAARLLVPPRIEHRVARRLGLIDQREKNAPLVFPLSHTATARSELMTQLLIYKRRVLLLTDRSISFCRKARSRCCTAVNRRNWTETLFTLLGYRLWWLFTSPFTVYRSECRSIVVIGGAARSGTTLLRTLLGRHPMLVSGPETTVFLHRISSPIDLGERLGLEPAVIEKWQRESRSQAEFIECVQGAMRERSGKAIWVEKTPKNVGRFRFVRRHFPHAKLVHIIRDGRDVVCSLRRTPFAKIDQVPWESIQAAQRCALQWRSAVKAGLRFRRDPLYYELRYEELVRNPASTLRGLTEFLEVPWDDCILNPITEEIRHSSRDNHEAVIPATEIFDTSVGRWRRDLTHYDCNALRLLISPLLAELGYDSRLDWSIGE
jgi:protein-tyrosine sulfotransferase